MDPGIAFAEALLAQLRADLKRFAPGRAGELAHELGRATHYVGQVTAETLQLHDAFAWMRFLGFQPAEYLDRFQKRRRSAVPPNAAGFFERHAFRKTDRLKPQNLQAFLAWARALRVEPDAPSRWVDLEARLDSLAFDSRKNPDGALLYADAVFALLASEPAETVCPDSARQLVRALVFLSEVLPQDLPHQRGAANLLDAGFRLESRLHDLELRQALFQAGARVSAVLGFAVDGLWCAEQALHLAALLPDFERVEEARGLMAELAEALDSEAEPSTLLEAGRRDQAWALQALSSDRATSSLKAPELDRLAGGERAFSGALRRRSSMTVARWKHIVDLLGPAAESSLERAAASPELELLPMGQLFQGLKLAKPHRPLYECQRPLLEWSREMTVSESAPRLTLPAESLHQANTEEGFEATLAYFQDVCRRLPAVVHPEDGETLCQGLLRSSYLLQQQNRYDDSADFLSAGFHAQRLLDAPECYSFGCRLGAYLAMHLGDLPLAALAAQRSRHIERKAGTRGGLAFSCYVSGFVALCARADKDARNLFRASLALSKGAAGAPPGWAIQLASANTCVRLREIAAAELALKTVEPLLADLPLSGRADFFAVKADLLSAKGDARGPVVLYDRAISLLSNSENLQGLALAGLNKCRHLLRFGQQEQARLVVKALLPLASRLKRNPIGRAALQTLVLQALENSIDEAAVEKVKGKVLYPNLSQ